MFKGEVNHDELFNWLLRYFCDFSTDGTGSENKGQFSVVTQWLNKPLWLYAGRRIGYDGTIYDNSKITMPVDRPNRVDFWWSGRCIASLYYTHENSQLWGWDENWKAFYQQLMNRLAFDFPEAYAKASENVPDSQQLDSAHGLTPRQYEIVTLILKGRSDKQIADELVISADTVSTHRKNIASKWGISQSIEVIAAIAREKGMTAD